MTEDFILERAKQVTRAPATGLGLPDCEEDEASRPRAAREAEVGEAGAGNSRQGPASNRGLRPAGNQLEASSGVPEARTLAGDFGGFSPSSGAGWVPARVGGEEGENLDLAIAYRAFEPAPRRKIRISNTAEVDSGVFTT